MRTEADRLAGAIVGAAREHARGVIQREVPLPEPGKVIRISPLTIQPLTFGSALTGDTLKLRAGYEPTIGDEVLLVPTGYGDWSVVDQTDHVGKAVAKVSGPKTVSSSQIRETGMAGQFRAGRKLTLADFTTGLGLGAPLALWNLNDLNDSSGNNNGLINGGTATFAGRDIVGTASSTAFFPNNAGGNLFTTNAVKQGYGTWGCWIQAARTKTMMFMSLYRTSGAPGAGEFSVQISTGSTGLLEGYISVDGSTSNFWSLGSSGLAPITDDKWHFVCLTWDGQQMGLYCDGRLDNMGKNIAAGTPTFGPAYTTSTSMRLVLGGRQVDATFPYAGYMDEAFVTNDVLDEDQIRYLYCAKVPHGLGASPTRIWINVDRIRPNPNLTAADFPSPPLVGYNFTSSLINDDYGSLGKGLTNVNAVTLATDVDGRRDRAANFIRTSSQSLHAPDDGLPFSGAKSVGVWFKQSESEALDAVILWWGLNVGTAAFLYITNSTSVLSYRDGAGIYSTAQRVADSAWHFVVVTQDPSAADGALTKIYLDGRCMLTSTSAIATLTPAGAGGFRLGSTNVPGNYFMGQLGTAFLCNYALNAMQIQALYLKSGGLGVGTRSPLDPGAFIERIDATNIYCDFTEMIPRYAAELTVSA